MAEETKHLETARADRSVWLMKCPTVVSRAWQEAAAAAASSSSEVGGANPNPNPNPVVAKVVLSLDPLRSDDQSLQFKMEMAQTDNGNTPKSYSLNMFKDFVPMCVFSESNQEKLACEGKVEHKFDMEPHRENLVDYGKLCRERTKKSMVKTRKVQVLENDHGMGMRPMPGMVGLVPSGPKSNDGNSLGPKEVHSYLTRVMYNRRNKFDPLWNSLVIGGVKKGPKGEEKYLGMVNMIGTHFEENHIATGFGNHLAIPILRAEWREDMTFEKAVKLVEKCLLVLMYRDRSSINKFQVGWDESAAGERRNRVSIWEIEPVAAPFFICPPLFFGAKRPDN